MRNSELTLTDIYGRHMSIYLSDKETQIVIYNTSGKSVATAFFSDAEITALANFLNPLASGESSE